MKGRELHEIVSELMEEELVEAGFVLLHREDSFIGKSQSSLEAARRPPLGQGRSPITILDTVQGDLLSSKLIIPFCEL